MNPLEKSHVRSPRPGAEAISPEAAPRARSAGRVTRVSLGVAALAAALATGLAATPAHAATAESHQASTVKPAITRTSCFGFNDYASVTYHPLGSLGSAETDCFANAGDWYGDLVSTSTICSGNNVVDFYSSANIDYFLPKDQCVQVDHPGNEDITHIHIY